MHQQHCVVSLWWWLDPSYRWIEDYPHDYLIWYRPSQIWVWTMRVTNYIPFSRILKNVYSIIGNPKNLFLKVQKTFLKSSISNIIWLFQNSWKWSIFSNNSGRTLFRLIFEIVYIILSNNGVCSVFVWTHWLSQHWTHNQSSLAVQASHHARELLKASRLDADLRTESTSELTTFKTKEPVQNWKSENLKIRKYVKISRVPKTH